MPLLISDDKDSLTCTCSMSTLNALRSIPEIDDIQKFR